MFDHASVNDKQLARDVCSVGKQVLSHLWNNLLQNSKQE